MFQALPKTLAFEEFLNWKPDCGCYELHDGVIVEMQPVGDHQEINGFLAGEIIPIQKMFATDRAFKMKS